ncbi:MAG: DUF4011 domain-containing protein [Deltaproteobacteria bacterium]|jgi:very-short-patch-repair endonuclease|nr:DUF4011 domain-containing protein [Deltaproteobacteria bacterium]
MTELPTIPEESNSGVSIEAVATSRTSFALIQNSIPVINYIEVTNNGSIHLENAKVNISSAPEFFKAREYILPPIEPDETYRLDEIDLSYDHSHLSHLNEAEKGLLRIEILEDDKLLAESESDIELLARNQWGGLAECQESVTAFVLPNDPAVERLLGHTMTRLRQIEADAGFDGYSRGKKAVWTQLTALWQAIIDQALGYILPPASFEQQGRKVRTPSQITETHLGTCLDISLLFAACLEQCGLHPLLIFTNGHAFTGCWLSPSNFTTTAVDDITAIRKRLHLREIVVFETSLVTKQEAPVSFSQACERGENNVREGMESKFECAIDIVRARMQRWRPLTSVEAVTSPLTPPDTNGYDTPPFALEVPPDLENEIAPPHQPTEFTPKTKVDLWQRKLLDLSLRNSLLNFRSAKRYVEIVAPNPEVLEDKLAAGEKFRLVSAAPLLGNDPRDAKLHEARHQEDILPKLALELAGKQSLLVDLAESEMKARLLTLYREARSAIEEGGANILYLVFGFLSWRRDKREKPCRAPLILIPARLERRSILSGFTLSLDGDEPKFNLTLLEMLRQDFAFTALDNLAKELPTDQSGLDIDGIWRQVQAAIVKEPGWEVSRSVSLGLFSFAKYLMWKDLADHTDIIKQNPVVNHLLGSQEQNPDGEGPPFLELNELDTKLAPQNVYCPLLADSSQLAAIISAAQGKDFVLKGPPGTGKSQTIANMIAQCLAENKTILFVAEKTAALNVVYRRLKAIGLEEFCLELHSNKANKPQVLAKLQRAATSVPDTSDEDWVYHASRLASARDKLNQYVRELHTVHPNGLTLYQALGEIIKNSQIPHIKCTWPSPQQHDRQKYADLFEAAQKLEDLAPLIQELRSGAVGLIAWETWTPLWEEELTAAAEALRDQCLSLSKNEMEAGNASGLPLIGTHGDALTAWMKLTELLPESFGHDWKFTTWHGLDEASSPLNEAVAAIEDYNSAWTRLTGVLDEGRENTFSETRLLKNLARLADCFEALAASQLRLTEIRCQNIKLDAGQAIVELIRETLLNPAALVSAWQAASFPGTLKGFQKSLDETEQILAETERLSSEYEQARQALSASYDEAKSFELNLADLETTWEKGQKSWWLKKYFLKRHVIKSLQGVCNAKAALDCSGDLKCLKAMRTAKNRLEEIKASEPAVSTDRPGPWSGFAAKRENLKQRMLYARQIQAALSPLPEMTETLHAAAVELKSADDFGRRLRSYLRLTDQNQSRLVSLHDSLSSLLSNGSTILTPGGRAVQALTAWRVTAQEYRLRLKALTDLLHTEKDWSTMALTEISDICSALVDSRSRFNPWCAWLRASRSADSLGLKNLREALLEGLIAPGQTAAALRVNYARWWAPRMVDASETLCAFTSRVHERTISDFRALDDRLCTMAGHQIVRTLRSGQAMYRKEPTEWRILERESKKKKRHMPIRQLVNSLPTLLPKLTPCLLMSPLSIAQYLEAGRTVFDLVIFDEASQIPVWDAIGAMARGKRVVVVGDQKQLPPTAFFQKADDEDQDDDAMLEMDLESILDECLGIGLPCLSLQWHYRSRHESLIAFSNHRYYDGRLVTFPSPDTEDRAVTFHFAGGVYGRSGSRTNPIEARDLVADLTARLSSSEFRKADHPTIGVVTFNSQQQTLIEDLLDEERREDPSLDRFFDESLAEPVMVKNLENIQGDERDIMYFSVGFAPDAAGHMSLNFGALNKDGGQRRLNVAITRARAALKVFCSFYPEKILLSKTHAKGVRDLRLFLEYAQNGSRAMNFAHKGSVGDFESPFEEAVAKALADKGWEIHPQIGVSEFRIDLGVVDPDEHGRYLAGVECDGATYHRHATARDRDRLRENVLRGLGWEIIRIWSTDWWIDAAAATEKLHSKLQAVLEQMRERHRRKDVRSDDDEPTLPDTAAVMAAVKNPPDSQPVTEVTQPENGSTLERERIRFFVRTLVAEHSPIHVNALCRAVARQLGLGRAGSKIRNVILQVAEEMFEQSTEEVGDFFWNEGESPGTCNTFKPRSKDGPCQVVEIAMPELVALARLVKNTSKGDPIAQMARKLRLSRLHASTRARLEKAWTTCWGTLF